MRGDTGHMPSMQGADREQIKFRKSKNYEKTVFLIINKVCKYELMADKKDDPKIVYKMLNAQFLLLNEELSIEDYLLIIT